MDKLMADWISCVPQGYGEERTMSNLEHLVENGLVALEKGCDRDEWFKRMDRDVNWLYYAGLDIEDLWTICIYVFYTYVPCVMEERGEDNEID